MAIIDILTHYDAKKKAAHAAKTVKHGVSEKTRRVVWLPPYVCVSWITCLRSRSKNRTEESCRTRSASKVRLWTLVK